MRVLVVGDVFLGRRISDLSEKEPRETFAGLQQWIERSDLAIFNLEGPVTTAETAIAKTGPALKMAPESADFLKRSGFDVATLANNHVFDFGVPGLRQTFARLEQAGLDYLGAGENISDARRPLVRHINGLSLGVLNFAENEWSTTHGDRPGANPVDSIANFRDISRLKTEVDYVIVICHGGHETSKLPSPAMRERLRFYVEAGADAVVNHHQHVVSGVEVYQGAPILYGIGNCLFDGGKDAPVVWTQGAAVTLSFENGKIDFEMHHFDQCKDELVVAGCSEKEVEARSKAVEAVSAIIADDKALESAFEQEMESRSKMYRAFLMPTRNRYLQALHNRNLFPGFLSRPKKRLYLNLLRCESHREALVWFLETDLGIREDES